MPSKEKFKTFSGSVVFLIALVLPSFLVDRTDTSVILASYLLAFGAYLTIWNSSLVKSLLTIGLLARIGLFFCMPILV